MSKGRYIWIYFGFCWVVYFLGGSGWWWVVVDVYQLVVGGGGRWWIYFGWWLVVLDGDGWWWVVVDIFWLVVGGGGWWWVVVGGGIVQSNPNVTTTLISVLEMQHSVKVTSISQNYFPVNIVFLYFLGNQEFLLQICTCSNGLEAALMFFIRRNLNGLFCCY